MAKTQIKNKVNSEYYNSIAKGYDELHGEEQLKKLEMIGKELTNDIKLKDFMKPSYKILDVGCGSGISTGFFSAKEKCGIDPSSELISIASKNNPHAKFIVGGAEDMPYKDYEFDIVISLTAIQNFEDISKGLDEIKRVGKRYILTFLKRSEKKKLIEKFIEEKFEIIKRIEEEKDIIYFSR